MQKNTVVPNKNMNNKPNYTDLGLSSPMGVNLRKLVESQLKLDLKKYGIDQSNLKFDWSHSCIEGHDTKFLDGSLENYSGILVYYNDDKIAADGWMEFIHEGDFFIAYWDFVRIFDNGKIIAQKEIFRIPEHIWDELPNNIKPNCFNGRIK